MSIEQHFTHWARQINIRTGEPTLRRHTNTCPKRVAEINAISEREGSDYRLEIIRDFNGEAQCPCCPDVAVCPLLR